jgi:hypothetical protein
MLDSNVTETQVFSKSLWFSKGERWVNTNSIIYYNNGNEHQISGMKGRGEIHSIWGDIWAGLRRWVVFAE